MSPRDALAIFTDGLTEVGASRTVMLGVEGVASPLAGLMTGGDAEQRAESLVLRLIAGVHEFARTGAREKAGVREKKAHEGNRTLDLFFTKEVLYH